MKKIIAVVCAALVLATMTMPAIAAKPENGADSIRKQAEERREERKVANEKRQQAKAENKAKLDALKGYIASAKTLKNENLALRKQNTSLSKQLSAALKSIKKNHMMLPSDVVAQLAALKDQLKNYHGEIASTKGDVHSGLKNNKANVKNRDFAAIQAAYEGIIATLKARNEDLKSMNAILSQMLSLVKGATPVPIPTSSATPTSLVTPVPTATPVA